LEDRDTPKINIKHVRKTFDTKDRPAVNEVSMSVYAGEVFVLLGSSGCGKSTLLKLINRLLEPDAGTIEINGVPTSEQSAIPLRRSIGYVIQHIGLFPHWNIADNVGCPLRICGISASERNQRSKKLLDLVGLDPGQFANRFPAELSGGQQQRVGVARALAADPDILLMDEPFGALDGVTRESLQEQILKLKKSLNKTILFVTHDLFEALMLADRIGVMHEGKIEQIGTPQSLLQTPKTRFVRELFERPARQLEIFQQSKEEDN